MIRRSAVLGVTDTLPQRVVSALSRDIESGELAPGSRLPTEQQLASRLGVSRNVIREAVAQLRADGLVEARQGVGAFVRAPEQRDAIRIDRNALREPGNMQRLFELRSVLETEAAAIAATRRTPQQLDCIKSHLDRMGGEEKWEDGSIDADLAFHREIAAATGNGYIHTFVSFVCEQIRQTIYYARQTNPLHDLVHINVGEHVRIYEALVAADPHMAAAAMRNHIHGAAQRVGVTIEDRQHPDQFVRKAGKAK
ncbi:MAG TPA: FadR/GntR family transcriptional regulator [Rhizobiaceae bacterium]|nr:FadR/GntR family transcriptional regulator [Rhizobiaceae bacterium]